ncbi:MAG: LysM peptidoglycan-binding domain-containing protein [Nocardiopsaceae bacterium]|nr:LysM peptidoglycan-binding domain-containing protein [Nocardiopsaceae bacterium]
MSEPCVPRPSEPADSDRRAARIPRRPHGPALFDWEVEIPEWRAGKRAHPSRLHPPIGRNALPELPELPALDGAAAHYGGGALAAQWARLTRRGRVVLISVASAAVTAVLSLLFLTAAAAGASASGAPTESLLLRPESTTVTVRDGDTLWEIAERVRPDADPRRTVHEIVRINELTDPELTPGQELTLPES